MSIFNNLVSGPGWPGNYVQPNTAAPAANANVASYATGANSLNLTWPIASYSQPGVTLTSPLPAWANSGSAGPSA